jgi:hypothetical protein
VEFHHIAIRVPEDKIAAWDAHMASEFPKLAAPAGFAMIIAKDNETRGLYHMASVLADRDQVFRDVRAAGGGPLLLHPLLDQFGAEIVSRERCTVQGIATPKWTYPAPA